MWLSTVKSHTKRNAVLYVILVTAFLGGLLALSIAHMVSGKHPKQIKTYIEDEIPTVDQAISAIMRVSPKALQVCYDEGVTGYLLQFEVDGTTQWRYTKHREMWKSENGTWMTTVINDTEWAVVGPDVTGLTCNTIQ